VARAEGVYATDLFISEYIEGSSNNKAIEIYNGTEGTVDLSNYTVELYSNGAITPNYKLTLSGTLASGEVYIIGNSAAVAGIKDIADIESSVTYFNGDDALVLKHNDIIIDSLGKVGEDPGSVWGSDPNTTGEHTLVRKSTIISGDVDSSDAFDPTLEWDSYPQDTFTYLGSHTMDGSAPVKVANVTATPSTGQVLEGTTVTLSTVTDGATVYYAVYTSDSTEVDYVVFDENNPVVVNEPLTIKSYAAKTGLEDSDIAEFAYTIKPSITIKSIAEARGEAVGTEVLVQGIVTGLIGNNVFIQDDTAGIYLYSGSTVRADFLVGNEIKVKGKTAEFNGLYQISSIELVEKITENNELPLPKELTIAEINEGVEGQLVKITNVEVETVPSTPADSNYSIKVTDGTNSIDLRVDSYLNPKIPSSNFNVGDIVTVTAPIGEYKTNYQLMIRTVDDIAAGGNYATNLFISEYIEGSSNNKAIEIYNGTGSPVDLSAYRVELYSNGATTVGNSLELSGTLAHDDVYIIANGAADPAILAISDITSAVTYFNGDDALVLKRNDEIIDVFGQVGVDPGSVWGTGDYTTAEHTLVRKSSITSGDAIPDDVFDPIIEWDSYPQNTFDYLGSHGQQNPDTTPPTIIHTPVTEGNAYEDIAITATVTDDRQVESVKLYYKTKGEGSYTTVDMIGTADEYIYTISKAVLTVAGIEYYVEATDGTNAVTSPEDSGIPYEIIISDEDIIAPIVTNLIPSSGSSTGAEIRPIISAEYSDVSGIDLASIKLYLDNIDVTESATITETKIDYTPDTDLTEGDHTVRLEVSDRALTPQTAMVIWNFYVGEKEYVFYYGQLHSHTNISDGQGTLADAYTWARDNGEADFFAVTDHSNWFDNDTGSENITDVSQSASNEWKLMNSTADSFNEDGNFVAIAGYEMTWSGSTGGWGHINTFNTPWFASRSNGGMDLPAYYNHIAADTDSISQLNHPGTTFGDFADFGFYSEAADNVVHLIEVGNGEGPIRGSGYFPSYEYYTRALDKGWHVAPSNNQDNHKAGWVTANEARTVVLAPELNRNSIFDAIRNLRVYSTEDSNLEIMYTVNGNIMGSMLDSPNNLSIIVDINDPDTSDVIGKVSIIANGGVEVASQTFNDYNMLVNPSHHYFLMQTMVY